MSEKRYLTKAEVADVIKKLDELPSLPTPGMDEAEVLELLRPSVTLLIKEKGYSAKNVQDELARMNLSYKEEEISALIRNEHALHKKHKDNDKKHKGKDKKDHR
ncbi:MULTISPECIES: hypothetical protein [Pantoea]|uniref:hypothetical protein n=1 Tax=Pantoea TaxID=53335 RepID=UPI0005C765F9|nr:hypothetical protein [Pantoea ananatis]MDF7792413.1 hypothetical protein [Pantoea ananatis]PQK94534.1 hypothetical protein CG434_22870 [Pantoea ananatis]REE67854.1 hypothetical protein C7424_3656 [Pantoea ananatis]